MQQTIRSESEILICSNGRNKSSEDYAMFGCLQNSLHKIVVGIIIILIYNWAADVMSMR